MKLRTHYFLIEDGHFFPCGVPSVPPLVPAAQLNVQSQIPPNQVIEKFLVDVAPKLTAKSDIEWTYQPFCTSHKFREPIPPPVDDDLMLLTPFDYYT